MRNAAQLGRFLRHPQPLINLVARNLVGVLFTWQVLCNLCSLSQPLERGGDDSWLRRELHAFCRIRGVFTMHTAPMQARERWPRGEPLKNSGSS